MYMRKYDALDNKIFCVKRYTNNKIPKPKHGVDCFKLWDPKTIAAHRLIFLVRGSATVFIILFSWVLINSIFIQVLMKYHAYSRMAEQNAISQNCINS